MGLTPIRPNSKTRRAIERALSAQRTLAPAPKIKNLEMITMDVTPELAAHWLEGKCPNRNVSETLVNKFARDMQAGAWHTNGETIVFDENDALLDGQHRLWAIVNSGATVKMCIVKGAAPDSMDTFDTGRSRSFADVLQIHGKSNAPRIVSAAARWWHWYDNFRRGGLTTGGSPSHDELRLALNNHPAVEAAAAIMSSVRGSSAVVQAGIMCFVLSAALERDEEKAQDWFHEVTTGEDIKIGDPAHTLREVLIKDKTALRRMDNMTICAYTIKSWNAYYRGKPLKHLKWGVVKGGDQEAFPEFEGSPRRSVPQPMSKQPVQGSSVLAR